MVELNHSERSMRAKIVYYGPATGGKTTNLQVIHRRAKREKDFDLFSIDTAQNRTILFDLLPMSTPAFQNYQLRFQLIGVPGQKLYAATRKMLLKNADAIVFVANSAADRWTESLESFNEMIGFLEAQGLDPATIPTVFQYNKQDLGDTIDLKTMEEAMNPRQAPHFLAVANQEKESSRRSPARCDRLCPTSLDATEWTKSSPMPRTSKSGRNRRCSSLSVS